MKSKVAGVAGYFLQPGWVNTDCCLRLLADSQPEAQVGEQM